MNEKIDYDKDLLEDIFELNLFSSKSPALSHYYNDTELWKFIKESIKDVLLIQLMIFNLGFGIAPLHTFVQYFRRELLEMKLSKYDKQCLGSIVSIIFLSLGYKPLKRIYKGDSIIKYATMFV